RRMLFHTGTRKHMTPARVVHRTAWTATLTAMAVALERRGEAFISESRGSSRSSTHQSSARVLLQIAFEQLVDRPAGQPLLQQGERLAGRSGGWFDLGCPLGPAQIKRSVPETAPFCHLLNVQGRQLGLPHQIAGLEAQGRMPRQPAAPNLQPRLLGNVVQAAL